MRKPMKIATLAAAVCITSSVGILMHAGRPLPSLPQPQSRGYTDGKQCNHANGCNLRTTFSKCLACCASNCPYPWYEGCVDECIATFDPKDVYGAMIEATDTIAERKSEGFGESVSILTAVQGSSDRRMAHAARLLAIEAEDYSGHTGIFKGQRQ